MRYAYVKNGDVAFQLERIEAARNAALTTGPDAFLTDFLAKIEDSQVLLLSRHVRGARFQYKNATAIVFSEGVGLPRKLVGRPLVFVRMLKHLVQFRPDGIVCGSTGGLLWACYLASRWCSVPFVHSRHNSIVNATDRWYRKVGAAIDHWCVRRARAVICHGPYLRQQMLGIGVAANKLCEFDVEMGGTAYNEPSAKIREVRELVRDKEVILYLGRLKADKGVFDLFRACRERLRIEPKLRLVYAGGGAAEAQLRAEVAGWGLADRVCLLGQVQHEEVLSLLKLAKVVVTPTRPSFPEGRCMAAMESLASGVPVVAPNFGPFPFLVRHGDNGLLFAGGSLDNLRLNVLSILDDDRLYERLKAGAQDSRARLANTVLTFGEAAQRALKGSVTHRAGRN